jgi:hypothetical protein
MYLATSIYRASYETPACPHLGGLGLRLHHHGSPQELFSLAIPQPSLRCLRSSHWSRSISASNVQVARANAVASAMVAPKLGWGTGPFSGRSPICGAGGFSLSLSLKMDLVILCFYARCTIPQILAITIYGMVYIGRGGFGGSQS